MRCATTPAETTIFRARSFPTTSKTFRRTIWLPIRSSISDEISYAQNDFKGAIAAYELVLQNYPHSFKLGASLLKRGMAELEVGQKAAATRDLRDVVRRFPGSDEARRAQAKLKEMGVSSAPAGR